MITGKTPRSDLDHLVIEESHKTSMTQQVCCTPPYQQRLEELSSELINKVSWLETWPILIEDVRKFQLHVMPTLYPHFSALSGMTLSWMMLSMEWPDWKMAMTLLLEEGIITYLCMFEGCPSTHRPSNWASMCFIIQEWRRSRGWPQSTWVSQLERWNIIQWVQIFGPQITRVGWVSYQSQPASEVDDDEDDLIN